MYAHNNKIKRTSSSIIMIIMNINIIVECFARIHSILRWNFRCHNHEMWATLRGIAERGAKKRVVCLSEIGLLNMHTWDVVNSSVFKVSSNLLHNSIWLFCTKGYLTYRNRWHWSKKAKTSIVFKFAHAHKDFVQSANSLQEHLSIRLSICCDKFRLILLAHSKAATYQWELINVFMEISMRIIQRPMAYFMHFVSHCVGGVVKETEIERPKGLI